MSLRDAVTKLNNAVKDLSSLHVQTYTGTIEVDAADAPAAMDLVRSTVTQAKAQGKISLVAESYYKFDGDSYNFIAQPNADMPKNAMELHESAVASGLQTRMALMEFVKDAFD